LVSENRISHPIPNPASNQVLFKLNLTDLETKYTLSIYSVSGQQMFTAKLSNNALSIQVDVSDWDKGIYYYRIEGGDVHIPARKLVIIR
jgi:hypothetical protein